MNGVTDPDLIKKLNDRVPTTFDELTKCTRSFIQGEAAAADIKKSYSIYKPHDQQRMNDQSSNRSKGYRNEGNGRGYDKYTP